MNPLTLTDSNGNVFTFQNYEIPPSISFGSKQGTSIHTLIGGKRIVDCMGPIPVDPEWSGAFQGSLALTRARYLETQCREGTEFTLAWSEFSYSGVIAAFEADFNQENWVPYKMRFTVEDDRTQPINIGTSTSIDDAILGDMNSANTLGIQVNDGVLTGLLNTLDTAISAVSSFAKATTAVINSVVTPLKAVQARVGILISSSENAVKNLTTFGGIFPNNPVAQNAAKMSGSVNTFEQASALYPLNAVLGRMGTNLGNLAGSTPAPQTKTVQVSGGTLYKVAADEYGDPTQWETIATANGLTDPVVTGNVTLKIPPAPPGTQQQVQPKQ